MERAKVDPEELLPVSVEVGTREPRHHECSTIMPIIVTLRPQASSPIVVPKWLIAYMSDEDFRGKTKQRTKEVYDRMSEYAQDLAHAASPQLEGSLRKTQSKHSNEVFCRDYQLRFIDA